MMMDSTKSAGLPLGPIFLETIHRDGGTIRESLQRHREDRSIAEVQGQYGARLESLVLRVQEMEKMEIEGVPYMSACG